MTAKEILYKKCEEKGGCFLSGQVGWIVEAMQEYAQQYTTIPLTVTKEEAKSISKAALSAINKITRDYAKTHGINLK